MNKLKLAFDLFCKYITSNIIFILQITVTVILINVMIGYINLSNYTVNKFEPFSRINACYLMPLNPITLNSDEKIDNLKNQLESVKEISTIDQYIVIYDNIDYIMLAYDATTSDLFIPDIKDGIWINQNTQNTDIPIVISSENKFLKINQEIIANIYGDDREIKFKISGIEKSPAFYLDYNVASTYLSTNNIIKYYDINRYLLPVFFVNKEYLQNSNGNKYNNLSAMIIFDDNIDDATLKKDLDILSKYGSVVFTDEIYSRGIQEANNMLRLFLPYFICGFSVSLIGVFGTTVLTVFNNMRKFAIYYFLGCRWRNNIVICLLYIFIMLLISLFLVFIIYYFLAINNSFASFGMIIKYKNIIASILTYLVTISIPFLLVKSIFKRNSSMKIFRDNINSK